MTDPTKYYVTICVHVGRRLMSRDQPPTEAFSTLEAARAYFEKYKSDYVAGAPYAVRGIEWATINHNGKTVWREGGLPANL
jgi:hypothetical protein